jgi:DNA-binding MarR family transcriptional regulator
MPTDDLDKLIDEIFTASRLIRGRVAPGLGCHDSRFSHLQLATLRHVRESQEPLMNEVARYLRITPPSATSLVNGLVKAGLLRRTADAADRRSVRLSLTAAGRKTLTSRFRVVTAQLRHVLSGLGREERFQLLKIMKKISDRYAKLND